MAERLQGSDFQRFFLIRIRLLFHQEAQRGKPGGGHRYT